MPALTSSSFSRGPKCSTHRSDKGFSLAGGSPKWWDDFNQKSLKFSTRLRKHSILGACLYNISYTSLASFFYKCQNGIWRMYLSFALTTLVLQKFLLIITAFARKKDETKPTNSSCCVYSLFFIITLFPTSIITCILHTEAKLQLAASCRCRISFSRKIKK